MLDTPGYDAATGLYYAPSEDFEAPVIPASPNTGDVERAAALLQEVFCDFPYDSMASAANAIAALVSAVLRTTITGQADDPVG